LAAETSDELNADEEGAARLAAPFFCDS